MKGATLLFSHQGSTNPTTEGWSSALTGSGAGQAVTSGTTSAWQVMEPGGSNALTYNQNLTTPQLTQALTTGWELSATIQYVPPDPLGATALSNNAWCTLLINEGVVVSGTQKRTLYGLYFGNDASGNTLVRLYSAGSTYTVSSGFHDYRIIYDPCSAMLPSTSTAPSPPPAMKHRDRQHRRLTRVLGRQHHHFRHLGTRSQLRLRRLLRRDRARALAGRAGHTRLHPHFPPPSSPPPCFPSC
nr:hypothetical protein [Verrucomicrobium spinosum]